MRNIPGWSRIFFDRALTEGLSGFDSEIACLIRGCGDSCRYVVGILKYPPSSWIVLDQKTSR